MIAERHKWLLRDVSTCFDLPTTLTRPCRLCRVQEKGEIHVPDHDLARHLAVHRREKIQPREATE